MQYPRSFITISLLFCLIMASCAPVQTKDLQKKIEHILTGKRLRAGIAVYDFRTGESFSLNGEKRFPMQSVYKFPIAIALLDRIDRGLCSLSDTISVLPQDLYPDTWSPLREQYPEGIALPLSVLIEYAIARSDNNASDLLLKMAGGPEEVQRYLRKKGFRNIRIANSEKEIQSSPEIQFDNWAAPEEMIKLLKCFGDRKLLKEETHDFLWQVMAGTLTGTIRDQLPPEAAVVHKTGSSGRNQSGITAALNDVGIMLLPDGRRIAFAIFLTESAEPADTNAALIARIGSVLYREPAEDSSRHSF